MSADHQALDDGSPTRALIGRIGRVQGNSAVLARVARGGRQVHGRSTCGPMALRIPAARRGAMPGEVPVPACVRVPGKCLALSSATGSRLNAPERVLGVTGRNGAGASVLGEVPWLGREKWRLKSDF